MIDERIYGTCSLMEDHSVYDSRLTIYKHS